MDRMELFALQWNEAGEPVLINGEEVSQEVSTIVLEQLDRLGELSAEAQFLKTTITSIEKWQDSKHYLICAIDMDARRLLGYLKYGRKDLYFYNRRGVVQQINDCLCLLDFYVLSELQRSGLGKQLFDLFLVCEGIEPKLIAYDRPSPKLLPFLAKHYNLHNPDAQPNKYTIFPGLLPENGR